MPLSGAQQQSQTQITAAAYRPLLFCSITTSSRSPGRRRGWLLMVLVLLWRSFCNNIQSSSSSVHAFRLLDVPRRRINSQSVFFCKRALSSVNNNNNPIIVAMTSQNNMQDSSSSSVMESSSASASKNRARKVGLESLEECGARLRRGELVAFPTETVYGLGANAMDEDACRKIFAAKERPLTDPLIVHVTSTKNAQSLWAAASAADEDDDNQELTTTEGQILQLLCDKFWPGPLTLVAKAGPKVPLLVMAGTGFVACRNPNHAIARAVIDASGIPIAAPSANKFGHVSPTTADHVWDDLQNEDVWIVDEATTTTTNTNGTSEPPSCNVGVESSVVKLEMIPGGKAVLTMLRQGAISVDQLETSLRENGFGSDTVEVFSKFKDVASDTESTVSPGQAIRHYSPNVPSFLISQECRSSPVAKLSQEELNVLQKSVIVDYGKQLLAWKDSAIAYRDLSETGLSSEAAQNVFETLRWAEQVQGAAVILFPHMHPLLNDALALAVNDRLTRAASGKVINSLEDSSS
mmetsp:Transcript_7237/g.9439  ORF Transcript_7237/g.9439 Transcript_7237/m.9439 type:complete len:522 (-) Transcript_7237:344-1909(-)